MSEHETGFAVEEVYVSLPEPGSPEARIKELEYQLWVAERTAKWYRSLILAVGSLHAEIDYADPRAERTAWEAIEQSAARARKQYEGAVEGGLLQKGRRKVDDAVLRLEVAAHLVKYPNASDTDACRKVAGRHSLSLRTVLRRTAGYRRPPSAP